MFRNKYLTVKELKEILDKCPDNLPVANSHGLMEAEDIKIDEEFFNGDSANPNCEQVNYSATSYRASCFFPLMGVYVLTIRRNDILHRTAFLKRLT